MIKINQEKRLNQIITFLKSLRIRSKRLTEIINKQDTTVIQDFNQALIHSSHDKIFQLFKILIKHLSIPQKTKQ